MNIQQTNNIIVALDIGTSKIVTLIAEKQGGERLRIKGLGRVQSNGMKNGIIADIEQTTAAIRRSVAAAQLMSGIQVSHVYVGIAGNHTSSKDSNGKVNLTGTAVTQDDMNRAVESAKAISRPEGQTLLHVLTQNFIVDDQRDIINPLHMSGSLLEVGVHIVHCSTNVWLNITKCVNGAGLQIVSIVLEQFASSYAVLNQNDRMRGIGLIDIGGGSADIALFANNCIQYTTSIEVAGHTVTNDIAIGLRLNHSHAEEIKMKHASAVSAGTSYKEIINVPATPEHDTIQLHRGSLVEIVESRYEEIFRLAKKSMQLFIDDNKLGAGIIITGGASKIEGANTLAKDIFDLPVRLGIPGGITGLDDEFKNPIYATAVGLLLYALKQKPSKQLLTHLTPDQQNPQTYQKKKQPITQRLVNWITGF